jgi:hypothetical protein
VIRNPLNYGSIMKIRSAIGLGVAIIMLKLLMPSFFASFEQTLTKLFTVSESVLDTVETNLDSVKQAR